MGKRAGFFAGIFLFLLCSGAIFGQTTSLGGTALDPTGAAVPSAKITISNAGTGAQRATLTDGNGRYNFALLEPGTYRLTGEAVGMADTSIESIEVLVGTPATVDVTFGRVGAVQSSVSVTAESEQVNTTDATIGNAIGSQAIPQLPLEGRNVVGLLAIQPGVVYLGEPASPVGQKLDYRSGSVNGGKSDQANVVLDGVDVNDTFSGSAFTSVLRVTLDSVQEFRTVTSNGDAEAGRSSGAQVFLVTRSGTNAVHGSAYEYLRNTDTSANSFFNNKAGIARPKLDRNVFGGSLGGPIRKNRLFYFMNYEGRRDASETTALRTVPNATFRQGNFRYVTTSGAIATLTPDQLKPLDPQGFGVSAAVLADFNKYPAANDTTVGDGLNTAGFRFNASTPLRFNTYIAKFDYSIDSAGKHRIFWRGNLQNDNYAGGIPEFPGQPASSVYLNNSKGFAIGYTAILSSDLISTFHYGYTRQGFQNTGVLNSPYASFSGLSTLYATTLSSANIAPVHTFAEDLVWNKNAHTVSFGGDFRLINNNTSGPGAYSYGQVYANWYYNDGADLLPANAKASQTAEQGVIDLLGIESQLFTNQQYDKSGAKLPSSAIINRDWVQHTGELYIQDSWKVTSNLTATIGLRYSLNPAVYEANGYQVSPNIPFATLFDQRAALAASGQSQASIPLVQYNLVGAPNTRGLYPFQKDWAPRVALAYSPKADNSLLKVLFGGPGMTSIRAGWGMYYDNFGQALANRFSTVQLGLSTALRNPSNQPATALARYQGFYDVDMGPFAVAPPGGFPQTVPLTGQNTMSIDDQLKAPYDMALNLTIQREFKGGFLFQASFVDHQARRSLIGEDMMAPTNLVDTQSGMTYYQAAQILGAQALSGTPVANVAPVAFWQDLWPAAAGGGLTATQNVYKQFQLVNGDYTSALRNLDVNCVPACSKLGQYALWNAQYITVQNQRSIGNGNYNGLQLTLRKRFSHGVQFDYNFTWSKCEDLGSQIEANGGSTIGNPWIASQNKAVCDYDLTRVSSALAVVELPFGKGKALLGDANHFVNGVVGGWQLTGILTNTSGFVTSVQNGVGYPTTWNSIKFATQTGPSPIQKTSPNAPSPTSGGSSGPDLFVDPAAAFASYSPTLAGFVGQRNGIRGDGNFSLDVGLGKRFNLFTFKDQQHSLQIRAEAFNITNSVRFDVNNISLDNNVAARFGQYTQTLNTPRVFQFSGRYEF